jgi:hypothetical protein
VKHYLDKESHAHIAMILRTDRESVDQAVRDGVDAIAFRLGWRDAAAHWPEVHVNGNGQHANGTGHRPFAVLVSADSVVS